MKHEIWAVFEYARRAFGSVPVGATEQLQLRGREQGQGSEKAGWRIRTLSITRCGLHRLRKSKEA